MFPLLSVKYRVVISAWALAICAAIPPDDVQAQEIATADSVRKYKFLAKTAREKKEYDAAIGYYTALLQYSPNDLKAAFFLGDTYFRTCSTIIGSESLTTEFGMVSGVTFQIWSPEKVRRVVKPERTYWNCRWHSP